MCVCLSTRRVDWEKLSRSDRVALLVLMEGETGKRQDLVSSWKLDRPIRYILQEQAERDVVQQERRERGTISADARI